MLPTHALSWNQTDEMQVTLIPGDGVGAEITDSVKEIFESVNAPIEWDQYNVSGMSSTGEDLFKQAMASLKRNRVGLKGTSSAILICFQITYEYHELQAFFSHLSRRPATSRGM